MYESGELQKIVEASVVVTPVARPFGVGDVVFLDAAGGALNPIWACVSRPDEVREAVQAAIRRMMR